MAASNKPAKTYQPAHAPNLELVDSERAIAVREDEEARMLLFRQTYMKGLNDGEWELLNAEAAARGLSILHKEICAIKFGNQLAIFPTIHGYYKLAASTGLLDGIESQWTADGRHWVDAWVEAGPPAAARTLVYLKGRERPFVGIATFQERKRMYQPKRWDDRQQRYVETGEPTLMEQWRDQPAHMLAKCATADALRKTGLVGDVDPNAIAADPFEAGSPTVARLVDDEPAPARSIANRNAHRAAAAALGDGGDAHGLVRETLRAINPDLVSVSQATTEELEEAGEVIEVAGADAPSAYDPDAAPVDPETGEILASPREEWAATVDAVLEAHQTSETLAELRGAAGRDAWKWAAMIRHPRLSKTLAERYVDLGERACGAGHRDLLLEALQARRDARAVEAAAGERNYREAQASMDIARGSK